MKILFVHDHILRKVNEHFFSTGSLSKEVVKRYIKENDIIYLYTRVKNEVKKNEKLVQVDDYNINCYPSTFYKSPLDYYTKKKKLKEEIKEVIKEKDFFIIRLPSVLGGMVYEEIKKTNKPYVIEMVACPWDSLWNYGKISGKLFAPIMYLKTRRQVRKARNVVYVSNEFLQKRYPTKGKKIGCSNVNIGRSEENVLSKRIKKINGDNEILKIGLIGSLDVNFKGHDTAIKIMSLLNRDYKNIEMHFLGVGSKDRWIKSIKNKDLEEHIKFDGVLPSGEPVYAWMDDIDIFIIPSLQEGLPRALIEAMSRGCPAVGYATGGIPELIEEEYVCKRNDYKQMYKKIDKLLNNKKEMIRVATRNYNESKKYLKEYLNKKRDIFFKEILNKNGEIRND